MKPHWAWTTILDSLKGYPGMPKTDLENDRLEEVDLRATAAVGLKYSWIEEQNYKASLRGGAAFRFEELTTLIPLKAFRNLP